MDTSAAVPEIGAAVRTAVLVEGRSDQVAVQVVAERRGLDLDRSGIAVVPMGGATNVGRYLARLGPAGLGLELAGLCDAREEPHFRRALAQAGLGTPVSRTDLASRGFFVCVADLEEEMIRALGVDAVLRVVDGSGELAAFRLFQRQPAQRSRTPEQQLQRFLGTLSGRKIRYAQALAEALDLTRLPPPLAGLVDRMHRLA